MKSLGIMCLAVALVLGMFSAVSADEPAALAQSSLASMGLGGMRIMSDDEGTAVRGLGAFVNGHFGNHKMTVPFDHKKFDHRNGFDHKKGDHGRGFDKKIDHGKGFDKKVDHGRGFGHKNFGHGMGHKSIGHHKGGGMIWPTRSFGHFGGKSMLW
jgi:hypothetical protein